MACPLTSLSSKVLPTETAAGLSALGVLANKACSPGAS
uniref:Uncharacterized protein n=1 Tax=Lepeophtheirus salmonis TaxID=72036 RepID=A0A0K2VKN3_LEPSM